MLFLKLAFHQKVQRKFPRERIEQLKDKLLRSVFSLTALCIPLTQQFLPRCAICNEFISTSGLFFTVLAFGRIKNILNIFHFESEKTIKKYSRVSFLLSFGVHVLEKNCFEHEHVTDFICRVFFCNINNKPKMH